LWELQQQSFYGQFLVRMHGTVFILRAGRSGLMNRRRPQTESLYKIIFFLQTHQEREREEKNNENVDKLVYVKTFM
jgi:hypothetical protein